MVHVKPAFTALRHSLTNSIAHSGSGVNEIGRPEAIAAFF
jgi:hypothetical protein